MQYCISLLALIQWIGWNKPNISGTVALFHQNISWEKKKNHQNGHQKTPSALSRHNQFDWVGSLYTSDRVIKSVNSLCSIFWAHCFWKQYRYCTAIENVSHDNANQCQIQSTYFVYKRASILSQNATLTWSVFPHSSPVWQYGRPNHIFSPLYMTIEGHRPMMGFRVNLE